MLRPLDALEETIYRSIFFHRKPGYNRPGALVERMGSEVREALSKLTSDDTLKVRTDHLGDDSWYRQQEASRKLMEFDRTLRR
jgi:hypothetical protein